MTGGIVAYMFLVQYGPELAVSSDYANLREAIHLASRWVITPSMLFVMVSGLLAMAVHHPFQNALWVWSKALMGLLIFEAVLASVDGPARRAAVSNRPSGTTGARCGCSSRCRSLTSCWGSGDPGCYVR